MQPDSTLSYVSNCFNQLYQASGIPLCYIAQNYLR
ncbi:hypothetical protein FQN60_012390 [Etheostoma spectabile]|uniref:Uncharacterized protein n=1 Tax=Etheostoma spectabile TaxID=54343 RepID=A0A5J5DPG8_9PERO|nr:hypothetical protein FQN60_012390 [Etheostoma spectabile]